MRKKCIEYLLKPTPAKLAKLTTMEQKWCAAQSKAEDKKPASK